MDETKHFMGLLSGRSTAKSTGLRWPIALLNSGVFAYAGCMNLHIALFIILLPMSAFALETDNYLSWRIQLTDSSNHINQFLRQKIIQTLPAQRGKSCQQVTEAIAKNFASYFVHDDPISQHLIKTLTAHEMFPTDIHHVPISIYRDPFRFYIPQFGLAPNLQVNGFYFGMDKLSHFGATGMLYLQAYQKAQRNGASDASALEAAINYGIKQENTVYGYWASGVYSFADLEADFQGLLFYQRLCLDSSQPYLQQSPRGEWSLVNAPDIRDYVNAYWDETFNLSYRLPGNWQKVKAVILAEYCPLRETPVVIDRRKYYAESEPSFSTQYLQLQQNIRNPKIPEPALEQSIDELCR